MQIETTLAFLSAAGLLAIMPGPDVIYVIMQSITNGKKYGIATAFGLVSGVLIHTSLIAFGISKIIQKSDELFFVIKLFGAIYLFYLAYQTYKNTEKINLSENVPKKKIRKLIKQGFIMNVLNPKVTIFFLAFFPAFIDTSLDNIKEQVYILGFLFMIQSFIIFSLISLLADRVSVFIQHNRYFKKSIKYIQVITFVGIGIFILI